MIIFYQETVCYLSSQGLLGFECIIKWFQFFVFFCLFLSFFGGWCEEFWDIFLSTRTKKDKK